MLCKSGMEEEREMLKPYCLPSNPVFMVSSKKRGSHGKGRGIMGNVSVLMLCMLFFHPFTALSDQ